MDWIGLLDFLQTVAGIGSSFRRLNNDIRLKLEFGQLLYLGFSTWWLYVVSDPRHCPFCAMDLLGVKCIHLRRYHDIVRQHMLNSLDFCYTGPRVVVDTDSHVVRAQSMATLLVPDALTQCAELLVPGFASTQKQWLLT